MAPQGSSPGVNPANPSITPGSEASSPSKATTPGATGGSSDTAQSPSVSSSPANTSQGTNQASQSHSNPKHYSAGEVAGIALGVGIGLALITGLITWLIMRRQKDMKRKDDLQNVEKDGLHKQSGGVAKQKQVPAAVEDYLPQAADDKNIQTKTKTLFDQIELFVENFCLVKANAEAEVATAELSAFDSPYLTKPLTSLLPRAKDAQPLIKHSLFCYLISRISPKAIPEETLLPPELKLLSLATANTKRPGFSQCLSRWRSLTAYIRPDASSDHSYTSDRDQKIARIVKTLVRAYDSWINPKHQRRDCMQALTTMFHEAAALGIFLLSQPQELYFHWPQEGELEPGRMAVGPALVKLTDEYGRKLRDGQVMVSAPVAKM